MPLTIEPVDSLPYWTQQRRELAGWLHERTPSFEDAYCGAVRLLYMPTFPGRVHLICHVVRDIYRHLPDALGSPALPRSFEVFPEMIKRLAAAWDKHSPILLEKSDASAGDYVVSKQVYNGIESIVAKQKTMANQPRVGQRLAVALFRATERPVDAFIPRWVSATNDLSGASPTSPPAATAWFRGQGAPGND